MPDGQEILQGVIETDRPVKPAMLRGWRCRCPNCGTGPMLRGYLTVRESCPVCGEALHHQRHVHPLAQRGAMLLKTIGRGLQAMVHMDGPHLAGPAPGTGQQQSSGIRAPAQCHGQGQRGGKSLQGGVEGLGHASSNPCIGRRPVRGAETGSAKRTGQRGMGADYRGRSRPPSPCAPQTP